MLRILILLTTLAMPQDPPRPPGNPGPSPKDKVTPLSEADALARYNGMMLTPPKDAAGHWKMATWCEQNGLRPRSVRSLWQGDRTRPDP